ncbi:MAG TPA: aspartate 1-decarboxylase [Candidatus Methanomethylophilaceae archaeon]|nr:aspartate 1-decarboxylase [Candidatus Methanomethylophilaceae archaeon]
MLRGKIHRAKVTETRLDYAGSITVDADLIRTADIWPGEKVHVVNINNGARFETYVIEGEAGSGTVAVNGAAARLCQPGDLVIILGYELSDDPIKPKIVLVDDHNRPVHK